MIMRNEDGYDDKEYEDLVFMGTISIMIDMINDDDDGVDDDGVDNDYDDDVVNIIN